MPSRVSDRHVQAVEPPQPQREHLLVLGQHASAHTPRKARPVALVAPGGGPVRSAVAPTGGAKHLKTCSDILISVPHGANRCDPSDLNSELTQAVAETMHALSTPSRLRILGQLHAGPSPVNELASAVGMEPSAVSHQLRVLRHLGLVVGRREGRQVVYDLHDDHVGELLEQAIGHVEHLRRGRRRSAAHTELAEA